jgi:hypothetical protein
MPILINVFLDHSVTESLFLNKEYTSEDSSRRSQYVVDKRIYPQDLFNAPIFTFINCQPDTKTAYVLKVSMGPRTSISSLSSASGGMEKLQINVSICKPTTLTPVTLFLAKTGMPLPAEKVAEIRKTAKWGYECRVLSQPDKIIAYFYTSI